MPTIKEVAQAAGVSIATVSYVLNNKTDMVSAKTARLVLETAERLGYRPNITARNLQSSRTGLIGYAWHTLPGEEPHWLMDRFIYYLAQAAEEVGYHLLTFTHPYSDSIRVYDELMRAGRLDGFVLSETNTGDSRIPFLLEKQFPFVSFGRSDPHLAFEWVDTDSIAGTRQAVEYLAELGHRRIAFCGWNEDSLTGNFRYEGYQSAMLERGLSIPSHYITRGVYGDEHLREAFAQWTALPRIEQPTALVAVSDYVAITAMRVAVEYGFRIGETLSIVGFDDTPVGTYVTPTLTTLRQPLRTITSALIQMLEAILQKEPYDPPQRLFPPELIIRASSGAPQSD